MAKKTVKKEEIELVDHVVTTQDLIDNPQLVEEGVVEGETIKIPKEEGEKPTKKGKVSEITFHLVGKCVKSRTFSREEHGEDFESLADEFAETNAKNIVKKA